MDLKERNNNIRDFFNDKIKEYDNVHSQFMDTKAMITNSLNNDIKKVLDLGVGTGLELVSLFKRFPNAEVTAIDITENMLEELKKREFSSKVKTICGDFFEVDFGDSYDAVISSAALHHFFKEDKIRLYQKIYKALKEGGQFINSDRFVLTEKEERSMMDLFHKNQNNKIHIDTPLSIETEKEILEKVGFKNIEFQDTDKIDYKLMTASK